MDSASRMIKFLSDNDDVGAQAEYDRLIERGVDIDQFAAARLKIGIALAESDEMYAQWKFVRNFYFDDAKKHGYLPLGANLDGCTLDELRLAERAYYGDRFPPD